MMIKSLSASSPTTLARSSSTVTSTGIWTRIPSSTWLFSVANASLLKGSCYCFRWRYSRRVNPGQSTPVRIHFLWGLNNYMIRYSPVGWPLPQIQCVYELDWRDIIPISFILSFIPDFSIQVSISGHSFTVADYKHTINSRLVYRVVLIRVPLMYDFVLLWWTKIRRPL